MSIESAEQKLVEKAVEAADRMICTEAANEDRLLLLTLRVGEAFMAKVRMMVEAKVQRDIFLREFKKTGL
jgi:hypothetical protein